MAAFKTSLLFLGLLGSTVLIMLSFHYWDVLPKRETIELLQESRKQLLREKCDEVFSEGKRSSQDPIHPNVDFLIVDDSHGLIYCFIPKVACSNWKRMMFFLSKNMSYAESNSIPSEVVHSRNKLNFLDTFPRIEMKAKLKHYTKFLFVRDPFVRLISAYRDKFMHVNEHFYQNFGRYILRLYGNQPNTPNTAQEAFASGVRPSFHNFIQYLVDPQTLNKGPFEPHWRQMTRLCHPCLIQYDFVGHQETLQEDADLLLKMLTLKDEVKFPPSSVNMTSPDSVLDWFRPVSLEDRRKLYQLYEEDFRFFGYERPSKLLDG